MVVSFSMPSAGEAAEAGRMREADFHGFLSGLGLAPRSVQLYVRTMQTADRYFKAEGWTLADATAAHVAAYAATKPLTFASRSLIRVALGHYWEMMNHPAPILVVTCWFASVSASFLRMT